MAARDMETPAGRAAVGEICRAYWFPIYAFIRRKGYSVADASDLTQEYFVRLIDGDMLRAADPSRGRFRSFLRKDCGFFLADQRDRRRRIKQGGTFRWFSLDTDMAENQLHPGLSDGSDPDRLFERDWALTLLQRALENLERQEVAAGRGAAFDRLKCVLTAPTHPIPYASIAEEAGISVAAVHAAATRLRRRYGMALRAEVANTLEVPTDSAIVEEIRSLFAALGQG